MKYNFYVSFWEQTHDEGHSDSLNNLNSSFFRPNVGKS